MATKHEITLKINIAFGHLPFILKKSCVYIIHFFELFTKYDLINAITDVGFSEQMKWESLVESYLEKAHSCIDKQRRIYSNACDFLGENLDEERDNIIQPISIENKIIMEFRRVHHHKSLMITRFWQRSVNGKAHRIPGLADFECNFNREQKDYLNSLNSQTGELVKLFSTHCEEVINKSNAIRELLLARVNA